MLLEEADCVGIDLPCATFSSARRAPLSSTMPHRLRRRNPKEMFGLRGLSGADLEKARAGNRQVKHAIRTVKQCLRQGKSGYLENLVGSMVWYLLDRALSKEFKSGKLHFVVFDMCQYGTRWKKPTELLLFGPRAKHVQLNRCQQQRGLCSRTMSTHDQLSSSVSCAYGILPNGAWRTSLAQVYPKAFIKSLLRQLVLA